MATYLILNIVVILIVILVLRVRLRIPSLALLATLAILLTLTAIFDNLIVGFSVVDYDPTKILGLKIGYAPVEDFMYSLLAIVIVPTIWNRIGDRRVKKTK